VNREQWLESGEYLPEFLRDFHDQKNLFKCMHFHFEKGEHAEDMPNWRDGHIYTIDWFLWYVARRGYTLQKSRKGVEFQEFEDIRDLVKPTLF